MKDKLLVGRKPVLDAISAGTELEKVWISTTLKGDVEKELRALTRSQDIPLQYVPAEKISSITSTKQHQGVAAMLSLVEYHKTEDVLPHLYEQGKTPALLVLDGIEDVRNLGALARSAVWFGMDAIIIGTKRSARVNAFAYKASAGAIKDIIICREPSLTKALQFLKDSGVQILVSGMDASDEISNINYQEPIALVMGSEGKGVVRELVAMADGRVHIPGTAKVESLNVSVAGAILMYDVFRKRNIK